LRNHTRLYRLNDYCAVSGTSNERKLFKKMDMVTLDMDHVQCDRMHIASKRLSAAQSAPLASVLHPI